MGSISDLRDKITNTDLNLEIEMEQSVLAWMNKTILKGCEDFKKMMDDAIKISNAQIDSAAGQMRETCKGYESEAGLELDGRLPSSAVAGLQVGAFDRSGN